jgi:hypothetical protein
LPSRRASRNLGSSLTGDLSITTHSFLNLDLDLPLLGFYFLAPILVIIVHIFALSKLVMLAEKAKRFLQALEKLPASQSAREITAILAEQYFREVLAEPREISPSQRRPRVSLCNRRQRPQTYRRVTDIREQIGLFCFIKTSHRVMRAVTS